MSILNLTPINTQSDRTMLKIHKLSPLPKAKFKNKILY